MPHKILTTHCARHRCIYNIINKTTKTVDCFSNKRLFIKNQPAGQLPAWVSICILFPFLARRCYIFVMSEVDQSLVPIPWYQGEGKVAAAHVAFTKEHLLLDDVQRDRRFAEGLKWVDAKVALCMPVVKPDGECYAVLELYRTYKDNYDDVRISYSILLIYWKSCWKERNKTFTLRFFGVLRWNSLPISDLP